MKRILLLTVGILFPCFFGGVNARDLDGRYADSPLRDWFNHLSSIRAFAVPWRMAKPWLTPTGNQRMGITAFALETNGSMFQTKH